MSANSLAAMSANTANVERSPAVGDSGGKDDSLECLSSSLDCSREATEEWTNVNAHLVGLSKTITMWTQETNKDNEHRASLLQTTKALKAEIADKSLQIEELGRDLASKAQKQETFVALEATFADEKHHADMKLQSITEDLNAKRNIVREQNDAIVQKEKTSLEQKAKITELQGDVDRATNEKTQLIDENQGMKSEIVKLKSELQEVKTKFNDNQQRVDAFETDKRSMDRQTEIINQEKNSLLERIQAMEKEAIQDRQKITQMEEAKHEQNNRFALMQTQYQDVDGMTKQFNVDKQRLMSQIKYLKDRETTLSANLQSQEAQNLELRKWMKRMEEENKALKKQAVALQRRGGDDATVNTLVPRVSPQPSLGSLRPPCITHSKNEYVIPDEIFRDKRLNKVVRELIETTLGGTIITMVGSAIGPESEQNLIIACVLQHNDVDKDIKLAFDTTKLGLLRPLVLVFHLLAPHRAKVPTATRKRVMEYSLLERCRAIIDIVYWNDRICDCEANTAGLAELREVWSNPASSICMQQDESV